MLYFSLLSVCLWGGVVGLAWRWRGSLFAKFATVVMGVHTLASIGMFGVFAPHLQAGLGGRGLLAALLYLQGVSYLHFLSLVRARPRPPWWRLLISIPGMFFIAGTFLGLPWAIARGLGFQPLLGWLPYTLAGVGVVQSLWTRPEVIDIALDGQPTDASIVRPHPRGAAGTARPLHVAQISDPHLGPFMSEHRLRRICEKIVAQDPDLVLLTGDFLTLETQAEPGPLARALAPLRALPGRCFACLGNHDHESPQVVAAALGSAGVRLLVDEEAVVQTPVGPVQVLGLDHYWRSRDVHLAAVCARHPRRAGHLRLLLLHDPGAFRHLPHGEGDIVFSGHTHGGQLGLLSLGLQWTVVRGLSSIPDHGLWARGRDRLYVHRGTGHYGFPLRVGVPGEQSLLRLHLTGAPA